MKILRASTKAIAAFEELLVTPNSRFDTRLTGDNTALAADLEGYRLFKIGVVEPYRTDNLRRAASR